MTRSFHQKGLSVCIFLCLLLAIPFRSNAQSNGVPPEAQPDTTTIWHISTHDENEFFGLIIERTPEHIRLDTEALGEINIPIAQIRQMKVVEEDRIVDGVLWPENVQESRYFVGTNGFGLGKGRGYYQNAWVFFNQLAVGISDHFSIGVGLVPTFLFGAEETPIWITPRISLPVNGKDGLVHIGIGTFAGTVIGANEGGFGVLYGNLTIGSRDRNVNIGLGQSFAGGGFGEEPLVLTFGTMLRGGKKGYVLIEGFLSDLDSDPTGGFMFGGRTVGKNLSFDFGLLVPIDDGINFALPWISISAPFGN